MGAPLDQTIDLALPREDDANPEIERMWAWHRVQRLMNEQRSGASGDARDEIVRLCEGYSITSEYASFIVLENDAEYKRWKIERRNATRIDRDRSAQANLRRELEQLRRESVAQLGPNRPNAAARAKSQVAQAPSTAPPSTSSSTNFSPPVRDNATSQDIDIPGVRGGRSGGGAIDPFTGLIAAGLAGGAWLSTRRRRKKP